MTQSTINYPITVCGIVINDSPENKDLIDQLTNNGLI